MIPLPNDPTDEDLVIALAQVELLRHRREQRLHQNDAPRVSITGPSRRDVTRYLSAGWGDAGLYPGVPRDPLSRLVFESPQKRAAAM
jgi:hypothetical protein